MSSTGLTNPLPKKCDQVRLTIALAKYGFLGEVIHSARTGRYSFVPSRLGDSPPRNLAGTSFADSGRPFCLPRPSSWTARVMPFLAAFFGLPLSRTLLKNVAI